jgi:AAA domain, putative AbiEii toxin, Type IV TA system
LSEDIARVFEFERLEINPSPDDQTLQVFVNGKSYVLNEIGSGLAQFVIVLANAAIKKPTYILIDEPELNLHPSLQIDFLTTLASYAERGVLFSTHSMGLARAGAERVYAVRRLTQSESEVAPLESLPRLSDFVGELGFSGYKELGFDRILLVEGPTEVRTMQQFLRFLKKEHRIVIVPLGGSSLINGERELELQELTRISPKISAIIDSERLAAGAALSADRRAFQEVCRKIGIACHVLDRRATENYLSDNAVKRAKDARYRALTEFEKLGEVAPSWSKSENWRIAREMDLGDLRGTDLLRHLESL